MHATLACQLPPVRSINQGSKRCPEGKKAPVSVLFVAQLYQVDLLHAPPAFLFPTERIAPEICNKLCGAFKKQPEDLR